MACTISRATVPVIRSRPVWFHHAVTRFFTARPDVQIDKFQTITIQPADEKPTAGIVFLHGLGDTAHGWADNCLMLQRLDPALANVKWVLPTAEHQPVTLNYGAYMPAWYDIEGLHTRANERCRGIDSSREIVVNLVENLAAEVGGMHKVVLGGFSQGGALSLYTGLQMDPETPLAGMLVMSGYLPRDDQFPGLCVNTRTPVLQCHGEKDQMVLFEWAADTRDKLQKMDIDIEFKSYERLQHSASMEEMNDVSEWLVDRLIE